MALMSRNRATTLERHGTNMSYRDDLEAAVSLNEALQQELDHTKSSRMEKVTDKRSFIKRNLVAFVTIFSIVSYLFVAGICYTAWLEPTASDVTDDKLRTGVVSFIWPITLTCKLGAGIAKKVIGHKESSGR